MSPSSGLRTASAFHEFESRNRPGVLAGVLKEKTMKVAASVKKMCRNCKVIRRKGVVRVICTDPRHKQRQG